MSRPNMLGRIGGGLALLLLYVGAVVWLTWPLASYATTHLGITHIAAKLDAFLSVWVLAWETHALATAPWSLPNANIYHPAPHALFYGVTGFGMLPYFAPVFLATDNPTLAMNVAFLGCLALTAWTLHLVVRWWTGSHLGGVVAASVLLTNRFVMGGFVATAPVYAALQYFPLIVYFAATLPRARGGGARLALLVALQCTTDMVYVAPAVLAPLGALAAFRLARPATRRVGVRLVGAIAAAGVVLAPIYAGYARVAAENPGLRTQTMWSTPLIPLVVPEGLLMSGSPTDIPDVMAVVLVLGAVGLLVRLRRGEQAPERFAWAHGALWALTALVASLTPTVFFHGREIAMPQFFLAKLVPALQNVRAPRRLSIAALIALAILTGTAFAECMRWLRWRGVLARLAPLVHGALALLVVALLYANYVQVAPLITPEYPIAPAPELGPHVLAAIRGREGPLLEFPVVDRPIDLQTSAMYHSIAHWRPLLNGYGSYYPAAFPERMRLAAALPDPKALGALVRDTGLTTILVHTTFIPLANRVDWLVAQSRGDVQAIAVDDTDFLFAVAPTMRDVR